MKKITIKSAFSLLSSIVLLSTLVTPIVQAKEVKAKPEVTNWSELKPSEDQIISSLNIFEILRRKHYLKLPLDEQRSSEVYDNYLKSLDPSRSYFLQSDIDEFEPLRHRFFTLLKFGKLTEGFSIYQRLLQRAQERIEFSLAGLASGIANIDLTTNDELNTDREKSPWPKNLQEQNDLWSKRLKDDILRLKLSNKSDKEIAETLTKRYKNQLKRLKQSSSEDIFQTYINAFAHSYDPHTEYMSPATAENFDISMSLSLEGIGAVLQSDNDYVKVVRLLPAGPADKSKVLAPADRIIAISQEDKDDFVDVIGWRLEDVVKLIRGKKGSKVQLEIIPASNPPGDLTTKKISIVRDAIKLEDQAAKKYVLNIDRNGQKHKIGIIDLPAFYLDFKGARNQTPNYKSTTRDVRKLIAELQAENVEGIIIDLRNNGGGSLQEATELTGLFVPPGPAVQVRDNEGRIAVLDDLPISKTPQSGKSTIAYKGPLVVLINRLSASASEIFAGAMQDYNRALILGSQSFGKGTVQSVLPLKHGELKLTVAKFYRVSGLSTQNKGVIPDISYPDIIDAEQIGESSLPAAMPWDTIKPAIPAKPSPFAKYLPNLQKAHAERIKVNPDFIFLNDRINLMKKLSKETTISLNEKTRKQQKDDIDKTLLTLENTRRKAKGEKLLDKLEDLEKEEQKADENDPLKAEKDMYLVESANILLDYLNESKQEPK